MSGRKKKGIHAADPALRRPHPPVSETIAPPPLDADDEPDSMASPTMPDAASDLPEPGVLAADTALPSDASDTIEEAGGLSREHLRGLLEALIFASDRPMPARELARMASAPLHEVRVVLFELHETYARRGIVLDEVAGGWIFRTHVQFAPFVREIAADRPVKLTRAQIETLAIVAYRQPITRPEIDEVRGVDSGATLKLLLERDLVRILGKKDEPGRPILYGTTAAFLEFFGLKSLRDLPTLREFTELSDESRRVAEAELRDAIPEATASLAPGDPLGAAEGGGVDEGPIGEERVRGAHDTVIPDAPPTGDLDDPDPASSSADPG